MDLSLLVPFFVGVIFIMVAVGLLFAISKAIAQWPYKNQQPLSTVLAQVAVKWTRVSGQNEASPTVAGCVAS